MWTPFHIVLMVLSFLLLVGASLALLYDEWWAGWGMMIVGGILSMLSL